MTDAIFADPRLAPWYDELDGGREDLDAYIAIAAEFNARTALDVGGGTGCLALRLSEEGVEVTAVDPAKASLEVAESKPGAHRVRWIHGTAADVPASAVDIAFMTGNVAQVFLQDDDLRAVLSQIRRCLRPGGYVAFEVRRPERRVWEDWERQPPVPVTSSGGEVTRTFTLTEVALPLVSFRNDFEFADGAHVVSESTLRFRPRAEVETALTGAGFSTVDVREAPDRPGMEYVFIAQSTRSRW